MNHEATIKYRLAPSMGHFVSAQSLPERVDEVERTDVARHPALFKPDAGLLHGYGDRPDRLKRSV